jgi:Collagen triple helix repeat (20 copies)
MFSRVRSRIGVSGVIAVVALVVAMAGGAYAAGKFVITSTKQIKPSVLTQLKGSQGPAGPQGPAGANGKDGAAGAVGEKGAPGATGATGAAGTAGATGATGAAGTAGATGASGATGAKGATGATGATGTAGTAGEPWTPNNVLPPEAMETGSWGGFLVEEEPEVWRGLFPISFPIPLAAAIPTSDVSIIEVGGIVPPVCQNPTHSGTATVENPEAGPGELCVYETVNPESLSLTAFQSGKFGIGSPGAGVSGAVLAPGLSEFSTRLYGTWAVTAEE